jgi:hypothetical protein
MIISGPISPFLTPETFLNILIIIPTAPYAPEAAFSLESSGNEKKEEEEEEEK